MDISEHHGVIPKITHRIWFQGWENLPEKYRDNSKRLEELNPEFEHRVWDEHSLRRECELLGKPYLDKFNSLPHMIMKVDFGRYVVLYRYGGISIDTDMKPLRSLRETPGFYRDTFIVSKIPPPMDITNIANNAIIMCKPKHPIMKDLVDTCVSSTKKKEIYMTDEIYLDIETGPTFFNSVLKKHSGVTRLDPEYFEPCYSVDPECKVKKTTIMDHQHSMSWIGKHVQYIFQALFILYRLVPVILLWGIIVVITRKQQFLPRFLRFSTGRK